MTRHALQVLRAQQEADVWQERHDQQVLAAQLSLQQSSEAYATSCSSLAELARPLTVWLQQQQQDADSLQPQAPHHSAELASASQRYGHL